MINIQFSQLNNQFNNRISRTPGYFTQGLLLFFCVVIFFKLYQGYQDDFRPQGIHFWAQADRFSIARNYYDNGLNFFEPQTNYLEYSQGLTGVEFPAIQYISALIAKPFDARDHLFLIYRILSFAILCVGLQFLLLTIKNHGGNGFQQVLIPLFFLLSPLLLFYGFNLIPDIPSLALILISYYYFEKFRIKLQFNAIYPALAWGFGAALLKVTSAMFPIAYLVWFLIDVFFVDKLITKSQVIRVLAVFVGLMTICFGITYYFTIYANLKYQSTVFLSSSRHINKVTDFSDIWENIVCWHREYFRETQYWVVLISFMVSLNSRFVQKGVLIFKGIITLGMICFILLMGKQLMDHDYYAICTIVPFILMLSIDGLMLLTRGCLGIFIFIYIIQKMAPFSLNQAKLRQADVYPLPCREIWDYRSYLIESAEWVKKNKIAQTEVFFVLYDYPLNTPLVYLDRKGMVFNHQKMKDKALVDQWFTQLKPTYTLLPKQWEKDLISDRPELVKQWKLVYEGKEVLIFDTQKK